MLENTATISIIFKIDFSNSKLENFGTISISYLNILIHFEGYSITAATVAARAAGPIRNFSPWNEHIISHDSRSAYAAWKPKNFLEKGGVLALPMQLHLENLSLDFPNSHAINLI